MQEVRWGIVGCGDVTEKKSGPAFNKIPGSRLAAVMRRDAAKAEDYARRHGVPRWFSHAEDLIGCPEVNAVYVATPPGSHCELALKAAAAGKPCYVEKPMARNAEEGRRMVEAFERAGLPLFVAFYRRALPHFEWVRRQILEKNWGGAAGIRHHLANGAQLNPESLSAWRFQPDVSGGGLFWDLGSHALDLMDHWLGPLGKVEGHLWNRSGRGLVEEGAALRFEAGGVEGRAEWNFASAEHRDELVVVFKEAELSCACFGPAEVLVRTRNGKTGRRTFELPENIQKPLIETVVAQLLGTGASPSTGTSALRTNQVIDLVAAEGLLRNIPGSGK
jgi:predicted dehydrogenase